jgi:hypothetical protein
MDKNTLLLYLLVAVLIIAMLGLPLLITVMALLDADQADADTSAIICRIRQQRGGASWCECRATRPGSRWQPYPMLLCQVRT